MLSSVLELNATRMTNITCQLSTLSAIVNCTIVAFVVIVIQHVCKRSILLVLRICKNRLSVISAFL